MRTRPPFPLKNDAEFPLEVRRGAWDAALSTGALRLIDYDIVASLSHIYQLQTFYSEGVSRMVAAVSSTPSFDPASRNLVAQQLAADLGSVIFAEQTLMRAYQESLPGLQKATADAR